MAATHTHYYGLVGDAHVRGIPMDHVDPLVGQYFVTLDPPGTTPPIGTILTGATSGARGMVRRIINAGTWVLRNLDLNPWQWIPNETVNLDNGTSCHVSPVNVLSPHSPQGGQYLPLHGDERFNVGVPADGSDTPYWDQFAKLAQTIVVPVASVSGVGAPWKQGDRFSTSGGGAFTLQFIEASGSDYILGMVRKSGSIAASETITNTTTAGTGTIGVVNDDPPVGCWVPYHAMPALNGTATHYEVDPTGNSGVDRTVKIGPENRFLHAASKYHGAGLEVNDFGVRLHQFSSLDTNSAGDLFLGGVTVQTIVCSGTFPTSWVVGEAVTSGSYSATVYGWNATAKHLYVRAPNGQTLSAGTITGQTSATTATATGPAFGWQKGSKYFNDWATQVSTSQAATGASYLGQSIQWEGLALYMWETELGPFAPGLASWPAFDVMQVEWLRMINAMRAEVGDPTLRIGVWRFNVRSHLTSIAIGPFPFAFVLLDVIESLPTVDANVVVIRSDDQPLAHPVQDACRLAPDAYVELGERTWRALAFRSMSIASDTVEVMDIGLIVSHSQGVGNIAAGTMIGLDRDPDLWPSGSFGVGVSTLDPNVLSFNCDTEEWEVWACDQNSNTFWGSNKGTCGFEVPIVQRAKMRYSRVSGESARFGLIKLGVNGSCVSASVPNATATWDPALSSRQSVTATLTATVLPPDGMNPVYRIRLTGAAGTFSNPMWVVNLSTTIAGSTAVQGLGGNNSRPYQVNRITAKAGDGSWIEVLGDGAAETRSMTVTAGPPPLWPEAKRLIQQAFVKCAPLNLIPNPAWVVMDHGDNDLAVVGEFQDALQRLADEIERVFGLRSKGVARIPKVICQTTSQTPFSPDDDAAVDAMRSAQAAVAANLENATVADPSDLAMEIDGLGTWPRTHRSQNGVHRTARAHIQFGFRVDGKLGQLITVPPHPNDDSAGAQTGTGVGADYRSSAGGPELRSLEEETTDTVETSPSFRSATLEATPAQQTALADAIFESPDVAGYTDAAGTSVQRRTVGDLLALEKAQRYAEGRRSGIRRTLVRFD